MLEIWVLTFTLYTLTVELLLLVRAILDSPLVQTATSYSPGTAP